MKNILDVTCIYNVQTFSLKLGAKNWGEKNICKKFGFQTLITQQGNKNDPRVHFGGTYLSTLIERHTAKGGKLEEKK